MSDTDEIILHNYPQSPVAEKVRVGLGVKGAIWRSVEIPRLPPKPLLTKLTGGYRRTPVMQIGADLYCDSQNILNELDRRQPDPPFWPAENGGLLRALGLWTDGAYIDLGVKLVLGADPEKLDPAFAADRGQLYLGPDWAERLKQANSELPHLMAQMRAPLCWLNALLADGRTYLAGDAAGAIDAQVYYMVWFVRGRTEMGAAFLAEFENLLRWEKTILEMGHGQSSEMTPEEAIERAAFCEPVETGEEDPNDPQGLAPGVNIAVKPDLDSNEQAVEGVITGVSPYRISIRREEADVGALGIHFPRSGYKILLCD